MEQLKSFSNPNGLAYYNGTAFPVVSSADMDFIKQTNDMIVAGLKNGVSLKQQGIDYKEQMDLLESTLNRLSNGNMVTPNIVNNFCEYFGKTEGELFVIWYMNVIALEKLKVIKNDRMNGMMYMN